MAILLIAATATAYGLLAAPTAHADVLVNGLAHRSVRCGGSVKVGVWYQSFSGGPRWAQIRVVTRPGGRTVWERNVRATSRGRYWRLYGVCGSSYTVIYTVPGGTARFPFHVRP